MAARLKTYSAEIDGLHDWIVAAANQKAALEAFGVNQDLFAQGAAQVAVAPALIEAAQAHPGVALRRLKGSTDPFAPVAANGASDWTAALEAAAKAPKPGKTAAKPAKPSDPPPPPSRTALDKAEAALAQLETDKTQALADIDEERKALDAREAEVKARFREKLGKARTRVKVEAEDFRRAGG